MRLFSSAKTRDQAKAHRRRSCVRPRVERLEDRTVPSSVITTVTDISGLDDRAYGVGVQSDGKIVTVGSSTINGGYGDFAVVRYNSDLTLDTSYGNGGIRTTQIAAGPNNMAVAGALQPDGKMLAAGWTRTTHTLGDDNFAVARYTTAGALDTTFGGGLGYVTTNVAGNLPETKKNPVARTDHAYAMALDASGRIVAAGYAFNGTVNAFAVARYNSNGSLDTTFNGAGSLPGTVETVVNGIKHAYATAAAIQSDGKIVIGGPANTTINGAIAGKQFALVRYNTNGTLDTTFGSQGIALLSGSLNTKLTGLAIDGSGNIVATGLGFAPTPGFQVARFTPSGAFDTTFGGGAGYVTSDLGYTGGYLAAAVQIQSDGKIVASGKAGDHAIVARYNTDGTFDTTFNGTGYMSVSFVQPNPPDSSAGNALALTADGKYILAGQAWIEVDPISHAAETAFGVGVVDPTGSPLLAAGLRSAPNHAPALSDAALAPILQEARHRWDAAGVDTSSLLGIDVRIANLGGLTLGFASGHTITLDDNAAGWGWFVDKTPGDDSEFLLPGNQGERNRMDLLSVVMHEMGHVLGNEHDANGDNVMHETLAAGTRRMPGSDGSLSDFANFDWLTQYDNTPPAPSRGNAGPLSGANLSQHSWQGMSADENQNGHAMPADGASPTNLPGASASKPRSLFADWLDDANADDDGQLKIYN